MAIFFIQHRVLFVLLVLISSTEAARGGGGGRGKGKGGARGTRIMLDPQMIDVNSQSEYYNNPKGARIVKASHFDFEYILGHKIVFICEAQGIPRPQITWFKDMVELYAHPYLQIHEWKIGVNKTKSKMEIDPATQMDAGAYECYANNKYSVDRRLFKADFSISE